MKEQDDEDEEKDTVGGKLTAQLAREKMTEVLTLKRVSNEKSRDNGDYLLYGLSVHKIYCKA